MAFLATLVGAVLIFAAVRDIFQTLFHPSGKGSISRTLAHASWQAFRRVALRYPSALPLAGAVGFLATIASWVALLIVGWAFVYWPRLPDEFTFDPGMDPSANAGFIDALYLSIVSLSTLGYGDITPDSQWLRIFAPLQALIGFGLVTASITWLLSIYPALSHRRSLADEILLVRETESQTDIPLTRLDINTVQQVLGELTSQLITVRSDLIKFPSAYYFHSRDEQTDLPPEMPYLLDLAERASSPDCPPGVRARAVKLRGAIDEFSTTIASRFLNLPSASTEEVLEAYARDHLYTLPTEDKRASSESWPDS